MGALVARRNVYWVGGLPLISAPPLKGLGEWRVMWSDLYSEKITSYNVEKRWEGSKR